MTNNPFRRALDFQSRSSVSEAWVLHICVVLLAVLIAIGNSVGLAIAPYQAVNYVSVGLFFALMAVAAVPYASLFVRRFHDLGLSGWWAAAALVPGLGSLILIPVFLVPGSRTPNRFGPPPRPAEASPPG